MNSSYQILLVDDEPAVWRAFGRTLSDVGCKLEFASQAEPALSLLSSRSFDVIVSDLRMPGMSGLDLLRRARELAPDTRRVLLSGACDLSVAMEAINDAGVDQLILKPWSPVELRETIRRVAEEARQQDAARRLAASRLLDSLVCALDMRDSETQWHSRRVAAYARHMGEALGIQGQELLDVERGALLHDIGKIGVSDLILHKPSALTELEWVEMRRHPALGYEMLRNIDFLTEARLVVLQHQERFDGGGYPARIKDGEICVGARIFHIVDAFDAITNDRPYRAAQCYDVARKEITRCAGTQFDPQLVKLFCDIGEGEWTRLREESCREQQLIL